MTFDEDTAFRKSKESHSSEDWEEQVAPSVTPVRNSSPEEDVHEEHDMSDRHESSVEPPEKVSKKRPTPAWFRETLKEAEGYAAPSHSIREKKRPRKFSSYSALLSHIIDSEPCSFDEANKLQVWRDAIMEEYQSIMKNDVWEAVPRP